VQQALGLATSLALALLFNSRARNYFSMKVSLCYCRYNSYDSLIRYLLYAGLFVLAV